MLKEILQQFIQNYIALVTEFFSWYNAAGRRILDFLHNMFNGAFNALLLVAVLMFLHTLQEARAEAGRAS